MAIPPGQHLISDFPRFGLTPFANRFPKMLDAILIKISGDVEKKTEVELDKFGLPLKVQKSDFHCVTTWSCNGLSWQGYLLRDLYEKLLDSEANISPDAKYVIFHAQDGYKSILPLNDALADDVLLATHLNDVPLGVAHGAPCRIVAPAHYGYKSVKHLDQIEFVRNPASFKTVWYFSFLTHLRGRVAQEERARWLPNWLSRFVFSRMIKSNRMHFERTMQEYEMKQK